MLVNDLLTDIGQYLQEDYSTSPVWTKAEVFGYLKQVVSMFCQLTQLVDKNQIRLINATSGEADVPKDFETLYFAQHELTHLDIVDLQELDFVSDTWAKGTTGTPGAVSVIGSGDNAAVRFTPVPSSVWDGGSTASPTAGLVLYDGSAYWAVSCNHGVIGTAGGIAPAATPVLAGPSTYWDLTVSNVGLLITTASSSTSADDVALADASGGSNTWLLTCTDAGALRTSTVYTNYGIGVAVDLDYGTLQDFDAGGSASENYGVIVDAYATASATTPANIVRLDSSIGVSLYANTSSEAGMLWYKGRLPELAGYDSELWLSDGFVPIVLHGVLALAFAHDGDGRDLEKAKLMQAIFMSECTAVKEIFQARWA